MPEQGWRDKQGDIWTEGEDGLMHSFETRPFPREHVEKKWGPLVPARTLDEPTTPAHDGRPGDLREAVERLVEEWSGQSTSGIKVWGGRQLRALLAEHPAMPAEEATCEPVSLHGLTEAGGWFTPRPAEPAEVAVECDHFAILDSDWLALHDAALTAKAKAEERERIAQAIESEPFGDPGTRHRAARIARADRMAP